MKRLIDSIKQYGEKFKSVPINFYERISFLLEKKNFKDKDIVICAYNAGEGKVFDWIENGELLIDKIDYKETRNYLEKVNYYYNIYANKLINL